MFYLFDLSGKNKGRDDLYCIVNVLENYPKVNSSLAANCGGSRLNKM